jgi:hypothetical protein
MKKVLFLVMLFPAVVLRADYFPPSLTKLMLIADKVVYGWISCVDDNVIEVKIGESLDYNSETITIHKFREWSCGKRWAEYQVGEKSVFFLRAVEEGFYPMGGGNEGELPIQENKVYVHPGSLTSTGIGPEFERSHKQGPDNGFSNPYNGYLINLAQFWEATKTLRQCFTHEVNATGGLINVKRSCPEVVLDHAKNKNRLFKLVVQELYL